MIIKRIGIENYGKISGLDMKFSGGINEITEDNGFGKTTIASFIKAMFYGLAPCRANGKDFNDRKKFYPFSGGKFGGFIEFVSGGDEYRIERFFGKKSDLDDEMKVYKNSAETSELSPIPGLKLFGLDEESFEKTLFIDSEITEISSTGAINGLLGDFAQDMESGISFEDALAKLEAARKKYKAAKGNNDLISQTQAEISGLKTKIENIEKEGVALAKYYSELGELTEREKALSAELRKASAKSVEAEKWKTYGKLKETERQKTVELKAFAEKYPNGIPDENEIADAEKLLAEAESLKSKREAAAFPEEKKSRLQTYSRTFVHGMPSDEAFLKLRLSISELSNLRGEIENLKKDENARECELEAKFGSRDTGGALAELENKAREYREKEETAKNFNVAAQVQPSAKSENGSKTGVAVAGFSGIIAAVGFILATAIKNSVAMNILGYVLAAAGVVGVAAGVILTRSKRKNTEKTGELLEKSAKIKAEVDIFADAMRKLMVPFGYYSENGVMYDYAKFKSDAEEYFKLREASGARRRALAEKSARADKIAASIKNFLSKFSVSADEETFGDAYYELKSAADDFVRLTEEQTETAKSAKALEERENAVKRELFAFFNRYKLIADGNEKTLLKNLSADLSDILRLKKECAETKTDAENYRLKNNLITPPAGETVSTDEISARFNECQKAVAIKRREISYSESVYETLEENKDRLAAAEEKLKEYKEKRAIIVYAEEFLKAADEKMQQKYVAPIKNSLIAYAAPLEKALGEKIIMDKNFKTYFESGGEIRDDKHLSSGQRCILSLCFRLSLIENVFAGEKPFLVMDDPFVNLDETHIAKVAEFIKEIAKNEQIIYLCCHRSRKIL